MQVTLDTEDIVEIVDTAIENALAPLRADARILRNIINEIESKYALSVELEKMQSEISVLKSDISISIESFVKKIPIDQSDRINELTTKVVDSNNYIDEYLKRAVDEIKVPRDGIDGKNGIDGANGLDGKDGLNGVDGKDGRDGADGKDGIDGKDGVDGKNITIDDVKPFILEEVKKEVAAIPLPKDGKDGQSVSIDDVIPVMVEEYEKAIADIPTSKDGNDGKDGRDGTNLTIDDIKPFIIAEIDKFTSSIPLPKDGRDGIGLASALIDRNGELIITCTNGDTRALGTVIGKDGVDGKDGKDVSFDEIESLVENHIEKAILRVPPGKDGTSVTLDDVKPIIYNEIEAAVASIPVPKDGKNGESVSLDDVKLYIKEEISSIPVPQNGKDGTSVTIDDMKPIIISEVEKFTSSIPVPKDGRDGVDGVSPTIDIDEIQSTILDNIDERFDNVYNQQSEINNKLSIVQKQIVLVREETKDTTSRKIDELKHSISVLSSSDVNTLIDEKISGLSINDTFVDGEYVSQELSSSVAKAISIVAESPAIHVQPPPPQPIIVNVTTPQQRTQRPKQMTTRRDKDGNLVADIKETD